MPNQTKGPKVQRVDRAAKEKAEKARARQEQKRRKAEENAERRAAAKEEKERKRATAREAKATKAQELAVNKAEKVAQKALKTQSKADAKGRKRSLRAESKAKKALKKGHVAATQEETLPVPEVPAIETTVAEGLAEALPSSEGIEAAEILSDEGADATEVANDGEQKKKKAKKSKKVKERAEMTPQEKKKRMIFLMVIVVLVLLIVVSTFFLLRMVLGDGRKAEASSSTPEADSSSISMNVGTAGGSQVEDTQSDAPEDKEPASSSEKESSSSKKEEKPKAEKSSSEEQKSSAKEDKKEKPTKEQDPDVSSEQDVSTDTVEPVNVLEQAIAAVAGTTEITAMLGSGAVPSDQVEYKPDTPMNNPKPGQPVPKEKPKESGTGKDEPKKPSDDSTKDDKPSALTSTTETQKVDNFKFSEASLSLPPYQYRASTGLEAAVHRDIGAYLDKKDDRPGVQITAVVIAGTVPQANGSLRVLAYSWGSRYAIADNTLFDYGNLVGPCALDYSVGGGQYVLQKITLARGGDAFEASVREMCGDQERIAGRMVKKSYDLELRGQMLRNVSSYIQQNSIPVDFFRASSQVYNKDGSIYLPPGTEPEPEPEETAPSSIESVDGTESSLVEDYRVIQDMPE